MTDTTTATGQKVTITTSKQKASAKGFRSTAVLLAGAVTVLLVWMLNKWLNAGITPEISGCIQTVVVFLVVVFVPASWWVKYQQSDEEDTE